MGVIEGLMGAAALAALFAWWQDRRRQYIRGKKDARLEGAAEQYRREQLLKELFADAENDKPSSDADTRDRLRDHAAGR